MLQVFRELEAACRGQQMTLHHGDCVEGDALSHALAKSLGWRIEVHPPIYSNKRAWCKDADVYHLPRDYMDRNDDIAAACYALVATPDEPHEVRRSGTWSTVRRASKRNRYIIVIQPDGTIVRAYR